MAGMGTGANFLILLIHTNKVISKRAAPRPVTWLSRYRQFLHKSGDLTPTCDSRNSHKGGRRELASPPVLRPPHMCNGVCMPIHTYHSHTYMLMKNTFLKVIPLYATGKAPFLAPIVPLALSTIIHK